jgi:hypothetical protein
MNGPNYVKLSRVFALRLLSVFIAHYTALPPVRGGPCWSHSYVITASFRLTPTQTHTATPTARDPNLGSGNHDMSRLPTPAYPGGTSTHCLADARPAHSQRILDAAPPSLAPRPRPATPTARDPNLGSGNHDISRLPTPAYPGSTPIHGLTDRRPAYSQRISGAAPPFLAPRPHTTTPTARDPNLGSGYPYRSRLSALKYPDIAVRPSTALPTHAQPMHTPNGY